MQYRPGMDLQYKYVVRNGDGSVARWMAGDNFSLQTADSDVELPSGLRVSDSWDASVHAVEVREYRSSASSFVMVSMHRHCSAMCSIKQPDTKVGSKQGCCMWRLTRTACGNRVLLCRQIVELIKSRQAARSAAAAPEHEGPPASAMTPPAGAASTAAATVPETVGAPSASPESDEIAAIAIAAERALLELDAAISSSMELSESSDDPASAEVLCRWLMALIEMSSAPHLCSMCHDCWRSTCAGLGESAALAPLLMARMAPER